VLYVHGVRDIRQKDIHTPEPLVPEPSLVEVEIAIGKLKRHKSPATDQIPTELIKAGGETLYSEIHRLICSIWNKRELPQQWMESVIVPIYKKDDKTVYGCEQTMSKPTLLHHKAVVIPEEPQLCPVGLPLCSLVSSFLGGTSCAAIPFVAHGY
jgi:hypothetical protein